MSSLRPKAMGRRAFLRSQGQRGHQPATGNPLNQGQVSKTIAHGVCRVCGRRTFLFLPARMCERCMAKFNEMVIAAIEEMEEADGVE